MIQLLYRERNELIEQLKKEPALTYKYEMRAQLKLIDKWIERLKQSNYGKD